MTKLVLERLGLDSVDSLSLEMSLFWEIHLDYVKLAELILTIT